MTKLNPLEEVLFQSWARAHGLENHNDPNNSFDHRGLYKQTNGAIMPGHALRQMTDEHNANAQQEGGDVTFPDPYMAQAEMHKANLDSESKKRSDAMKMQLEHEKMKHKLMIEQMKMSHKSQEADKDRQHKMVQEEHARQQAAQDRMVDRQFQMQDAERARQQSIQDAQMNQEHSLKEKVLSEHFARTRPQPEPKSGMQPHMVGAGPHQGPPQHQPMQSAPGTQGPQGGSLQNVLMQRAMSHA